MELLPAMVAPVGLCSDKGLAAAGAAGHLQQHALLESPLGMPAAHAVHGPSDIHDNLASSRRQHLNSSAAAGREGTAAAADAEDVLMGEPTTVAFQHGFCCLGLVLYNLNLLRTCSIHCPDSGGSRRHTSGVTPQYPC
jgi:hypothetical protein